MNCLLLLLLSILPHDDVLRDEVDLVELNHFYDEHGRLVFDQVIFYNWCDNVIVPAQEETPNETGMRILPAIPEFEGSRYQVVAWRLVKNPNILPQRDWRLGGYRCLWHDGEALRLVRAKSFNETWTQEDPELTERRYLAKEDRRELKPARMPQPPSPVNVEVQHGP
jgi:hypothetical protein